eukprot:gi/632968120/ref/XP_007900354.1/ PREDICTED: carbonic anhydrase 6 [Callorhinchus milii]
MFQFTQGHWTYQEGDMDEEHWESQYPACAGKHQSPIDIQRKKTKYNPHLPQIQLSGYDAHYEEPLRLTNNGHSVALGVPPNLFISHGLQNKFTAVQMHFHWGGLDLESSGSEHTVDGMRYIAELHIVHYNSEKYKTFEEAHDKEDGLAVLAFFYEDGHFENTYYSDFISSLGKVRYAGQTTQMHHLDISTMLSDDLSQFYRYKGSLTTPPCFESITWTVFDTPIKLSHNQIRLLENSVLDWENKTLRNDYRHAQLVNDRTIEASFQTDLVRGSCHLDEINEKLEKIETILHKFQLNAEAGQAGIELASHPAFHFSEGRRESYVEIRTLRSMDLRSFSVCMWIRTKDSRSKILLSYATKGSDNELVISVGLDWGLWIGGHFVNIGFHFNSKDWVHYCLTWRSQSGSAEMWINGLSGKEKRIKRGHVLRKGGTLLLGKDQDGFEGIFSDVFVGDMTAVNMWDYVLRPAEIRELMECKHRWKKGNVIAWGKSAVTLFGGVRVEDDNSCLG